ncbi:MAG: hypothetical protein RL246_1499 [Bacteroidota bacterium]|jgi:NADH-quinone oxidoreductase subunit C
METKALGDWIQAQIGVELAYEESADRLLIPAADIARVCDLLYRSPSTYFDSLSCLTAIDNGPEKGTLDIIYTFYSIPFHRTLHVRVELPRLQANGALPEIPTVSTIWQTANWHEREAYDLVGVHFVGHPDLTRILMPADWEGHPLRKDYVEAEKYHGIQVKF